MRSHNNPSETTLDPAIMREAKNHMLILLGERTPSACVAHLVSSGLLGAVYLREGALVSAPMAAVATIYIVTALRFLLGRRLLSPRSTRSDYVRFSIASLAQSLGWVALIATLVTTYGTVHPLTVIALLTGSAIATGATVSLGSDQFLSRAFLTLIIGTMVIVLLSQNTLDAHVTGANALMYLVFLIKQSNSQYSTLLMAEYWRIEAGDSARKMMAIEAKTHQLSKYAAIGELASGMAHEVNNPLTILNGHVRQLEKQISAGQIQDTPRIFDTIRTQITRITGVVHGFLEYSAIDHSKMDQSIKINEIIRDAASRVLPEVAHSGRQLFMRLHPQGPVIPGNSDALTAALSGLILHALNRFPAHHSAIILDFDPENPGNIKITSAPEAQDLWLPYEMKSRQARAEITQAHWIGFTTVNEICAQHKIQLRITDDPPHECALRFPAL